MTWTRLYVESIETLKGQRRKKIFWASQRSDLRTCESIVHYLAFTNTKETKLSFIWGKLELRDTYQPFWRRYHHWSSPNPWYPPTPHILLSHSIDDHMDTPQPFLRVFIIEFPQPQSRKYSPIPLVSYSHHEPWRSPWGFNVYGPRIRNPPCFCINTVFRIEISLK